MKRLIGPVSLSLLFGVIGGLLGGTFHLWMLYKHRPSYLYGVVDTPKLIKRYSAVLTRRQPLGLSAPEDKGVQEAHTILKKAITRWANKHHMILFTRGTVLNELPDVTGALLTFLEKEVVEDQAP